MGEKFPNICDSSVCYYNKKNQIKGKLLYADTYCADDVLNYIRNNNQTFFTVVFHNSDWLCPNNIPNNCKIYAQNVGKENTNNNVYSLPIGLENTKWFRHINKIQKINNIKQKVPNKLCYCNFNTSTNPTIRIPAAEYMKKSYITHDMHTNGYNYDEYLNNILDHFFVFSPPGNGIDCHRTWEALYLNRVPIIYNVYKSDLFENLPVVIINSETEITEEFLLKQKQIILNKSYNFNKLKFSFWKDKIFEH